MNDFKLNDIMRFIDGEYKKLYSVVNYKGNKNILNIPEKKDDIDVYEIGNNCFDKNESIEEVILPVSIGSIGSSAFSFCRNLKRINLDNVNYIDTSAFSYSGIENILINNITEIGMSAFSNCVNLKEVVLDGNIKEIKNNTFVNCNELKKVILPNSIEKINDNAFSGCKKIEEIVLPETCKISRYAFEKNVMNKIKSSSKNSKSKEETYNLDYLLHKTSKMKKEEIELYVKELLSENKLDSFDTSDITNMTNINFNPKTGILSWKCSRHGSCSCELCDLLEDKGRMITNFDFSGCGFCK